MNPPFVVTSGEPAGIGPDICLSIAKRADNSDFVIFGNIDLLKKRVGVSQLIMGLDDPFPLGEMEGVGTSYPGRVIDYAVENGILTFPLILIFFWP